MQRDRPSDPASYPATYRDARGTEQIELANDGRSLRTSIRGVALEGADFDGLDAADPDAARAAGLTLAAGSLCACELRWEMPIDMVVDGAHQVATLHCTLILGAPTARGGLDREDLRLRLVCSRATVESAGTSGWFEDELLELQRALPPGVALRACISCGLSDYSPLGHGLFGGLACFRATKQAYRAVASKQALFELWDARTELVQETHVCPEFEPRRPGTGYRG